MRSAGKSAGIEEGLLVRPGGEAQHRIAMREAPEAADDVGMLLGVFGEFIIAILARQLQAAFLIDEIFRVHKRQKNWRSGCETCRSKPRLMARSATSRASPSVS